jgi:hypothetical protein
MFLAIAGCLVVLVLWGVALRNRPEFGFGIALGVALACVGVAIAPHYRLETIPVWLPALPFALVAITLFVFGVLAWFWGTDR